MEDDHNKRANVLTSALHLFTAGNISPVPIPTHLNSVPLKKNTADMLCVGINYVLHFISMINKRIEEL